MFWQKSIFISSWARSEVTWNLGYLSKKSE